MAAPALVVTRLEIERMPGFRRQGFTLTGLCAGVNVLYGPNGIGKTTAGRAIQALFWPSADLGKARLSADILLGGAPLTLDMDDGAARVRQDGRSPSELGVPPAEAQDRYRLAFHDLLRSDNASFAEHILRESAGGYDLAAACRGLGFRAEPQRPDGKRRAVRAAQESYRQAVAHQQQLDRRYSRLREMEEALRETVERTRRLAVEAEQARRIAEYRAARDAERQTAMALRDFPGRIRRFTGGEADEWARLRQRMEEARRALESSRTERAAARHALRGLGLPRDPDPHGLLRLLRAQIDSYAESLAECDDCRKLAAQAEAREREARRRRGPNLEFAQIDAVDSAAIGELAQYLRRRESLTGELSARRTLEAWTGAPAPPPDLDNLRSGVDCLSAWLAIPKEPGNAARSPGVLALAATAAVAAAWLAATGRPLALLLAVPIAAALWMSRAGASGFQGDTQSVERRYRELGLTPPAAWTADAVAAELRALRVRLAESERTDRIARQWEAYARQSAPLDAKAEELARERDRLERRYGIALDPDGGRDASILYSLEAVRHWQTVAEELAEARAGLSAQEIAAAARLRAVNETLLAAGLDPADSPEEARAACDCLDDRLRRLDQARADARSAADGMRQAVRGLRALRAQADTLLQSRVGDGDPAHFQRCCGLHPAYSKARTEWRACRAQRLALRARLRGVDGIAARDLRAKSPDAPDEELERAQRESRALEKEITEIRTLVSEAGRRHDVEAAYSALLTAKADLAAARDSEYDAVAGHALLEFVAAQSRDRGRPLAFRRANELLGRITQSRFALDFEDSAPPRFRAVDLAAGETKSLDELSSGTRIQLLIAVRLAFIEEMEAGVRLPIIVDEALANSDDERAQAVVAALLRLCGDGRQLFYLTAQSDEVKKWSALLEAHGDIPHKILDMTEFAPS